MLLYNDIIKDTEKLLREKCNDVTVPLDEETIKQINEMHDYLVNGYDDEFVKNNNIRPGVGIAAPQIGVLKRMFCILSYDEKGNLHEYCIVNPKIISTSVEQTYLECGEGCLSVESTHKGYVHRSKRLKAKCMLYDPYNNKLTETTLSLKGYIAVIFQHEYDHLSGILFYDRINKQNPFYIPENSTPVKFN